MSDMKRFMKIIRQGRSGTHEMLTSGSHITIQEKLDGANASFKIENGVIKAYSRNNELGEHNTLRGFYGWTQKLDPTILKEGYIYFGEWLVKHKLDYGENANKFYLFDVYDEVSSMYLDIRTVKNEAEILEIPLCPVFYTGEFQSMEHIMSFVGKSELGKLGEGVVVKNYDWRDKFGVQQFTKIVSDEFAEIQKVKKQRISPQGDVISGFVSQNLTKARVDKMLHKLVDEGVLQEDFDITNMGDILKNAGSRVYEDIIEEELDSLLKHVRSKVGKVLPVVVKEVLADSNRM